MATEFTLNKEQKQIIADLHSPNEEQIIETIHLIREVGGEYCISPLIDVFFSTPFVHVRSEIGRVFLDLKSAKMSKLILDNLVQYIEHKHINEFISYLWQSSVVFEDVTMFVEKFIVADDMLALDCLSLVENNLGNISDESKEKCRLLLQNNSNNFGDMKKQLAKDMIKLFDNVEHF